MKGTKRVFDLNKFVEWVNNKPNKTQDELKVAHFIPKENGLPWAVEAVGMEYTEFCLEYGVVVEDWFTEVKVVPYFSYHKYVREMLEACDTDDELHHYLTMSWVDDCLNKTIEECRSMFYVISSNWEEYR